MSKRVLYGLAPVLALGLAACGGGFTSSGDALTQTEAADLAEALAQGGFAGFGSFGAAAPSRAPGAAATTITQTLAETVPCDSGGTVAINGSVTGNINQTASGGTISFNYTAVPNACVVPTSGGKKFTISGDPNLKAQGDFTFTIGSTSEAFQGSLNYGGKFGWTSSDGRAGACGLDLTANYDFTFSGSSATGTATLSGTVCGVSVSRSVSVTP
jgi:hypothetical protein